MDPPFFSQVFTELFFTPLRGRQEQEARKGTVIRLCFFFLHFHRIFAHENVNNHPLRLYQSVLVAACPLDFFYQFPFVNAVNSIPFFDGIIISEYVRGQIVRITHNPFGVCVMEMEL